MTFTKRKATRFLKQFKSLQLMSEKIDALFDLVMIHGIHEADRLLDVIEGYILVDIDRRYTRDDVSTYRACRTPVYEAFGYSESPAQNNGVFVVELVDNATDRIYDEN